MRIILMLSGLAIALTACQASSARSPNGTLVVSSSSGGLLPGEANDCSGICGLGKVDLNP